MKKRPPRPLKLTERKEADIRRQIAEDSEDWEASESDIARARPFAEAFPELAESIRRARGRPPVESPKKQVTLRLDADVIERFRAEGPGWQGRINAALRKATGL